MELKTYIELAKTASYLAGAASVAKDSVTLALLKKASNEIEEAISKDLPWEFRSHGTCQGE